MKASPTLATDLEQVLKKLPNVDKSPVDVVSIPFKDTLLGIERSYTFGKRVINIEGVEHNYWVLLCFVASKGVQ